MSAHVLNQSPLGASVPRSSHGVLKNSLLCTSVPRSTPWKGAPLVLVAQSTVSSIRKRSIRSQIGAGGVGGGGGTGCGADCASPRGGVVGGGGRAAHSMTSGMVSEAHFVHTLHDSVGIFKHFSLLYSGPQVSAHGRHAQRFPTCAHAFDLFTQVLSQ